MRANSYAQSVAGLVLIVGTSGLVTFRDTGHIHFRHFQLLLPDSNLQVFNVYEYTSVYTIFRNNKGFSGAAHTFWPFPILIYSEEHCP
jgi:hypothetical protein